MGVSDFAIIEVNNVINSTFCESFINVLWTYNQYMNVLIHIFIVERSKYHNIIIDILIEKVKWNLYIVQIDEIFIYYLLDSQFILFSICCENSTLLNHDLTQLFKTQLCFITVTSFYQLHSYGCVCSYANVDLSIFSQFQRYFGTSLIW